MRFVLSLDIGSQRSLIVQFMRGFDESRRPIPMNLDGAAVNLFGLSGQQVLFSVPGVVLDAPQGKVQFSIPASATIGLNPGVIEGQFKITFGDPANPIRVNGMIRLVGGATP